MQVEPPIPVDKLACHRLKHAGPSPPCVLLACGSFNPPTIMHLRMMEAARDKMTSVRPSPVISFP